MTSPETGRRARLKPARGPWLSALAFILALILAWVCLGLAPQAALAQLNDDLFSVSFVDESLGWACGRWGTVLHTADGGRSWRPQKTGVETTLSSIQFLDQRRGWAVGEQGTILHTDDGGATWTRQESPVPLLLMDVHFADDRLGWIVTERTTILFTDDGGQNWRVQFKDQDYILKAVSFCDAQHGWAVGEYGYIYRTSDGGANWVKQAGSFGISPVDGTIIGGTYLFDVVALSPESAWAVGIDSQIIRTSDGGRTWQEIGHPGASTQLFCLYADATGQVLTGGNGIFLSSKDQGATWRFPRFEPPLIYGWIYGLARRGSAGFVAVGAGGAIYASAGGAWRRVAQVQDEKEQAARP